MFTHASAASVAPSRIAALPVSVRRKSRSGASRFRAQAVRPANEGVDCSVSATGEVSLVLSRGSGRPVGSPPQRARRPLERTDQVRGDPAPVEPAFLGLDALVVHPCGVDTLRVEGDVVAQGLVPRRGIAIAPADARDASLT